MCPQATIYLLVERNKQVLKYKLIIKIKFMKNILLLLLFPLLLLLTGCPYYSEVPLSAVPKKPIDTLLLGAWTIDSDKPEADSGEMKIIAFNKMEYYIDILGLSNGKIEIDRYRAFVTPVGPMNILNLEDLKQKGSYTFLRYKTDGKKLEVEIVSDECVKDKYPNSKTLMKAFTQKINDKTFFEEGLKFVKKSN